MRRNERFGSRPNVSTPLVTNHSVLLHDEAGWALGNFEVKVIHAEEGKS